jgi:hypothetical protein
MFIVETCVCVLQLDVRAFLHLHQSTTIRQILPMLRIAAGAAVVTLSQLHLVVVDKPRFQLEANSYHTIHKATLTDPTDSKIKTNYLLLDWAVQSVE